MNMRPFGLALLLASSLAHAGGMQIPFQNASSLGIAFANTPFLTNQASATFYNPAALTTLKHRQLQIGANTAIPSITYSGQYTVNGSGITQTVKQAQGGYIGMIPNFYLAAPINQKVTAGIGLSSSYGLGLSFKPNTGMQYALKDDEIINVDLTPALGIKLAPKLSWGVGLDFQYLENTNSLDIGTVFFGKQIKLGESKDVLQGYALGFHTGLLYKLNSQNQLALTFHSDSTYHLTGYSAFTSTNSPSINPSYTNQNFSSVWHLPWWISAGFNHQFNAKINSYLKLQYTGWKTLKQIIVKNTAGPLNITIPQVITPLNLSNSWTVVLGTSYQLNPKSLLQFGLAWDQGASDPTYRQIWLPDNDHYSVAIGWRYQLRHNTLINVGYDFAYMSPASVKNPVPKSGENPMQSNGVLKSTSSVIGFELTHNF